MSDDDKRHNLEGSNFPRFELDDDKVMDGADICAPFPSGEVVAKLKNNVSAHYATMLNDLQQVLRAAPATKSDASADASASTDTTADASASTDTTAERATQQAAARDAAVVEEAASHAAAVVPGSKWYSAMLGCREDVILRRRTSS
jgi:hypothetical protein